MTLDNEQQRKLLLEIMKNVTFPGAVLEVAYELKVAIGKASIGAPLASPPLSPWEGGI